MQRIQNLVTFKGVSLVKTNIVILFRGSAFDWYTFKLAEFDCDALDNNLSMKN